MEEGIRAFTIRRAIADDAQDIGAVFDAAVREGWKYLGELAARPMFPPDEWDTLVVEHAPPNVLLVAINEAHRLSKRANLLYNISPQWRALVGYSFIYWNNVVLAGNQIDTNLTTPLPTAVAPPFAKFQRTDFWVQGISLGGDYRW